MSECAIAFSGHCTEDSKGSYDWWGSRFKFIPCNSSHILNKVAVGSARSWLGLALGLGQCPDANFWV